MVFRRLIFLFVSVVLLSAWGEDERLTQAKAWMETGDLDKATASLQAAIDRKPKDIEARLLMTKIYVRRGKIVDANKILLEAMDFGAKGDEYEAQIANIRALALTNLDMKGIKGDFSDLAPSLEVLRQWPTDASRQSVLRYMGDLRKFNTDARPIHSALCMAAGKVMDLNKPGLQCL